MPGAGSRTAGGRSGRAPCRQRGIWAGMKRAPSLAQITRLTTATPAGTGRDQRAQTPPSCRTNPRRLHLRPRASRPPTSRPSNGRARRTARWSMAVGRRPTACASHVDRGRWSARRDAAEPPAASAGASSSGCRRRQQRPPSGEIGRDQQAEQDEDAELHGGPILAVERRHGMHDLVCIRNSSRRLW